MSEKGEIGECGGGGVMMIETCFWGKSLRREKYANNFMPIDRPPSPYPSETDAVCVFFLSSECDKTSALVFTALRSKWPRKGKSFKSCRSKWRDVKIPERATQLLFLS